MTPAHSTPGHIKLPPRPSPGIRTSPNMSLYTRTPHMVTPGLPPQPIVYTTVSNPSHYHTQRRQSMGPYYPPGGQYHLSASEPSRRSRSHHRSSSRSHRRRRSHSVDRHGGHHHRHRSTTPSRSKSARYFPETHHAVSQSPFYHFTG